MIERDVARLDDIAAKTGEHFDQYMVLVKDRDGMVSWRGSDSMWADGACRQYINYLQLGQQMQVAEEFYRRNG